MAEVDGLKPSLDLNLNELDSAVQLPIYSLPTV